MSVNNISFILHKPQLSENIGACARGMKNFNFNKLILVHPNPIFPKTTEATAAKLLIFISIISVILFFGAKPSK